MTLKHLTSHRYILCDCKVSFQLKFVADSSSDHLKRPQEEQNSDGRLCHFGPFGAIMDHFWMRLPNSMFQNGPEWPPPSPELPSFLLQTEELRSMKNVGSSQKQVSVELSQDLLVRILCAEGLVRRQLQIFFSEIKNFVQKYFTVLVQK